MTDDGGRLSEYIDNAIKRVADDAITPNELVGSMTHWRSVAEALEKIARAHGIFSELLLVSVRRIRDWHGEDAFDVYYKKAPEMKEIREFLGPYELLNLDNE